MATRSVDPKWIRNPSDTLAVRQGCWFDEEAGQFVCDFIETFCCQSADRWKGKPIELIPWQRDFLMRLFGWKLANGLRRFRRAYLEVAKKNGKSTMLSAVVLYLLLADGQGGPKIFLNACDKDQAKIIFDESKVMIEASPALACRLRIIDSKADKRIIWDDGNGSIVVNSSVAPSKDGLNPSAIIFDELHEQPDRRLVDVYEHAGAARSEPIWIDITTAGEDDQGVWFEQRDYSEKVNRGDVPDISHLGVVYRALPEDDIDNPETWRKANPSLGYTLSEDEFRLKLQQAKETPRKLAKFLRYRLNIITKGETLLLNPDDWEACNSPRFEPSKFANQPCWGGLDLSSTTDLTALVLIWGSDAKGFDLWARMWLPRDSILEASRRDRVPYQLWAEQGWLELTDGNVIDYDAIRKTLKDLAEVLDLRKLLVDPHNARQLCLKLKDEDGLPVEPLQQGFISLSDPTKQLERLVLSHKLRTGGNPILKWMAGNAVIRKDPAGNIKLDKDKSRKRIDGLSATVNSLAGTAGDDQGPSVYSTRGLMVL
jgi:phage terminase large subunit-like protein